MVDAGSALHTTSAGSGPRVVLVHGFSQTGLSWKPIAADLAGDNTVCSVDLPGHGHSGPAADLWRSAAMLGQAGGRAGYVGYSLGGRVGLHLALAEPELVERLVLLSATAGIDDPAEREQRRDSDEMLARSIERDGVDVFLERWLAQPLFAGLEPDAATVDDRRANTAADLAASLRLAGTGTMDPPLWERIHELAMPVLVLAGQDDRKFVELGRRLATGIGDNARLEVVAGAGHAAHLEQPERFLALVKPFLLERPPEPR